MENMALPQLQKNENYKQLKEYKELLKKLKKDVLFARSERDQLVGNEIVNIQDDNDQRDVLLQGFYRL